MLTVPDSLLLLQWCGAISGADSAPLPKKSSTHSVFQQVLVNDLASNPDSRPRTMSLGLSELGSDDIAMPSREQIKFVFAFLFFLFSLCLSKKTNNAGSK